MGLTETEAKSRDIRYEKGAFPWAASGRALSQGRAEGITKLLFDPNTERVIGAAVTGSNAGDLIAEAALAIEMNADAQDIGLTIHAHPTLAETIGFAAEAFEGTITALHAEKEKVNTTALERCTGKNFAQVVSDLLTYRHPHYRSRRYLVARRRLWDSKITTRQLGL